MKNKYVFILCAMSTISQQYVYFFNIIVFVHDQRKLLYALLLTQIEASGCKCLQISMNQNTQNLQFKYKNFLKSAFDVYFGLHPHITIIVLLMQTPQEHFAECFASRHDLDDPNGLIYIYSCFTIYFEWLIWVLLIPGNNKWYFGWCCPIEI